MGFEYRKQVTIIEARLKLEAMLQQELRTGSISSEIDSFKEIIKKLETKAILPEDALAEADRIVSGRQDYH